MSFPSKFTRFDNSILAKICFLIDDELEHITLAELIKLRLSKFSDVSEFMLALDILYVLGKIDLDTNQRVITYVK